MTAPAAMNILPWYDCNGKREDKSQGKKYPGMYALRHTYCKSCTKRYKFALMNGSSDCNSIHVSSNSRDAESDANHHSGRLACSILEVPSCSRVK